MTQPAPVIMPFKGIEPTIGTDVFIAPNSSIIGDVRLKDRSSVWFNCVLRGDDHYIEVGEDSNVQDGSVVHVYEGKFPTIIGKKVTIGHGVMLHGCIIEDECMIGIGAKILDGAYIETGAVVAAGAVVAPGKRVKSGEMWTGVPAKFLRPVKEAEKGFIENNWQHYHQKLARKYLNL